MPFLSEINIPSFNINDYPFNIPSIKNGVKLKLRNNVTFFVGENGSGKSTLLETVAETIGFSLRGGNKNHNTTNGHESLLTKETKLTWIPKRITNGFFMRAESFFNFADYIDELAKEDSRAYDAYGGKSLHHQSHGESFLSLFTNKFEKGIYILDEPEAALSPARILSFITIINQLEKSGRAQFLIATHSPMLLCYPGANIFSFDENGIQSVDYEATEHYTLTKIFLNNPDAYFRFLFNNDD